MQQGKYSHPIKQKKKSGISFNLQHKQIFMCEVGHQGWAIANGYVRADQYTTTLKV